MTLFDLAVQTTNVTTSQAALEIIGSNLKATKLYEIGIEFLDAEETEVGLGRPAAIGVTPGTTTLFQNEIPGGVAAVSSIALTWGTSPTAPSIYLRRFTSSSAGAGVIWTFPEGLSMGLSGITRNLVLFNITGGSTLDCWAVVGEGQ